MHHELMLMYTCTGCGMNKNPADFKEDSLGLPYGVCRACRGLRSKIYYDEKGQVCTACHLYKPHDAFNRRSGNRGLGVEGRTPQCRDCLRQRDAALRLKNGIAPRIKITRDENGRTCTRCGQYKPRAIFSVLRHSPDGLRARCKACDAELARDRRQAKKTDAAE